MSCIFVYICKYCVCAHGSYDLLDFKIKQYLSVYPKRLHVQFLFMWR